jgi:hypothetical protein
MTGRATDRRESDSRETCADCDDPILPGDLVRSTCDGPIHDRCPSDTETL